MYITFWSFAERGTSGLALIMRFRRKVCYANFLFGDFFFYDCQALGFVWQL